jgi:hypothetical protein
MVCRMEEGTSPALEAREQEICFARIHADWLNNKQHRPNSISQEENSLLSANEKNFSKTLLDTSRSSL